MDRSAARIALRQWRDLDPDVRKEAVALARASQAVHDQGVAERAVNWGRSEQPLSYAPILALVTLGAFTHGSFRYSPATGVVVAARVLPILAVIGLGVWLVGRHRFASLTARVNLSSRVAADAYQPQATLEVRTRVRPWWFIPGLVLVAGGWIGWTIWAAPDRAFGSIIMAAIIGVPMFLFRRARRPAGMPRFPGGGQLLLSLGPEELRFPQLNRTVPWADVTVADVAPADPFDGPPFALEFRSADREQTVIVPTHWLDEDPGVILATARHFMAAHR